MKKSAVWSLVLMIIVASVYRVLPTREYGFAPQLAMALFAGAIFKRNALAFVLPLLSMLVSDALYQVLYVNGYSKIPGFYQGQWVNYLVFASVSLLGFLMKKINLPNVLGFSVLAPTYFFLVSNFMVWAGDNGGTYPKTFEGLVQCFTAGLPFYGWSIAATIFFAGILFGSYYLITRKTSVLLLAD